MSIERDEKPEAGSCVARHLAPQNISPLRKAMKEQLETLKQANSSRRKRGEEILPAFAASNSVQSGTGAIKRPTK